MTAITISKNAKLPIQIAQWVRNGKYPSAELQNMIATLAGHAALVRPRLVYHTPGLIIGTAGAALIPSSVVGTRYRWEFPYRSAPYAHYIYANFQMAPQNLGTPNDPIGFLDISTDAAYSTTAAQAAVHFGSSDGSYPDTPINFGGGQTVALDATTSALYALTPNTQYFCRFGEQNYGRIQSAVVWEFPLSADTDNGYPAINAVAGGPIYDEHRERAATMGRNLWAYGAQTLWHWSAETDASSPSQGLAGLSGQLAQTLAGPSISAAGTSSTTPPTYQAQSSLETSTGPDITLSWPTHATDDLALLFVTYGVVSGDLPPSAPSGWTSVTAGSYANDGISYGQQIYYRRATSSSMGTVTIAHPVGTYEMSAVMLTVRGAVTSGSPIDYSVGTVTSTSTSHTSPSGTATYANELMVVSFLHNPGNTASGWTNATTTVTERVDHTVAVGTGTLTAAGAFGGTSITLAASNQCVILAFTIKP
jgi:hypothetical protein